MKVCFLASDKAREQQLADVFLRGCIAHGDDGFMRSLSASIVDDCDAVCMVGVKSREVFNAYRRAGKRIIYLDKGYSRHRVEGLARTWEFWRVSVGDHHPTATLMSVDRPFDRLERLKLDIKPWRASGETLVIAGSSEKYHQFYGLVGPTKYATGLVSKLRKRGWTGEIVYRPKPSWRDAVAIPGTRFSPGKEALTKLLESAHVLVTHGSNACFEAAIAGVPSIILGEAVAKPISSTSLRQLQQPMMVSDDLRRQWLANLAYCQWTLAEIESGEAWNIIRPQIGQS